MRTTPRVPAEQLGSVALRYRGVGRAYSSAMPLWRRRSARPELAPLSGEGRNERLRRLEAVLLLAREPLNTRKLSQYANLADGTEARTLVRRLNKLYDESGRAFRVEHVAGGYRLMTRPQFASWLRRLEHVPAESRLSAPALETLAVVAYRQPVLRADIEAIRGVNCGEILRQLMERDLVRIGGRSDELGRPYLYTTTKHFLEVFGLQSLDKLPRAAELRDEDDEESVPRPSNAESDETLCQSHDRLSEGGLKEEESDVSVTTANELHGEELETQLPATAAVAQPQLDPQNIDDDEDVDYGDDEEEDEDEEDEYEYYDDDEEDDVDDEEELDEDDDEEDDEDDFEEWEEVDDEDEDWDDEDVDWEDEDDEFEDDEEEVEEEEEEEKW